MKPAISIRNFSKRYGRKVAVDDVSYEVQSGSVCGLLGQNGAGKTTTIRCMLDLLRPTSGSIEVLGRDSVRDSVEVRRRVGYLPEEPTYYPWMRVEEIVGFNSGFFPAWDGALCEKLLDRVALPRRARLRELSRGMQAKVGLVMALSQRPEVLVLDDPTSGLDPIVRREFFEAMIETVQSEGGTVFFSTHLLNEMERIADQVAVMHESRLLLRGSVEQLKRSRRRLRAVFEGERAPRLDLANVRLVEGSGHHVVLTVADFDAAIVPALRDAGFDSVEVFDMDLEEIFVDEVARATGTTSETPPPEPAPRANAA